jgi:hypothetical protein
METYVLPVPGPDSILILAASDAAIRSASPPSPSLQESPTAGDTISRGYRLALTIPALRPNFGLISHFWLEAFRGRLTKLYGQHAFGESRMLSGTISTPRRGGTSRSLVVLMW